MCSQCHPHSTTLCSQYDPYMFPMCSLLFSVIPTHCSQHPQIALKSQNFEHGVTMQNVLCGGTCGSILFLGIVSYWVLKGFPMWKDVGFKLRIRAFFIDLKLATRIPRGVKFEHNIQILYEKMGNTFLGVDMRNGQGGQVRNSSLQLVFLNIIFHVHINKTLCIKNCDWGCQLRHRRNTNLILEFFARLKNKTWNLNSSECTMVFSIYAVPFMYYQTAPSHHLYWHSCDNCTWSANLPWMYEVNLWMTPCTFEKNDTNQPEYIFSLVLKLMCKEDKESYTIPHVIARTASPSLF